MNTGCLSADGTRISMSLRISKLWRVFVWIYAFSSCALGMHSFSTGGHTVYHLKPATVETGKRAVISATYDGSVLCHNQDGQLVWKTRIGGHFPFDIAVSDIDDDGRDETVIATAAGILYTIDGNQLPDGGTELSGAYRIVANRIFQPVVMPHGD